MILLVGCGNVLRRDDGAGPALVRRVLRRSRRPDLEAVLCHQLSPELAPRLADPGTAAAVFADAALAPGDVPLLRLLSDGGGASPLGHHLTPQGLLALAGALFGRRPPAWLASVPGEDFGFGRGLSPSARHALRLAEEEILRLLEELAPPIPPG